MAPTEKKSTPKDAHHLTIRDKDRSLRDGLDELRSDTKDDAGFPVDRSTMVRMLVDDERARRKKRR